MSDLIDICFIDDSINVCADLEFDDTARLNRSNLQTLLAKCNGWREQEVKDLVEKLVEANDKWSVSAFTHPDNYLNAVEEECYRPQVIIYDWEYPGGVDDPATKLKEILELTYAAVFIYSGTGHEAQIDAALETKDLMPYIDRRLFKLMKEEGSPDKLLAEAQNLETKNFSFRFGKDLRIATLAAVDNVLVEFGNHDKDFIKTLIAEQETVETQLKELISEKTIHNLDSDGKLASKIVDFLNTVQEKANSFMDLIKGQLSNKLSSIPMDVKSYKSEPANTDDKMKAAKKLLAFRLYYFPSDNIVRTGDIIHEIGKDKYFLVITAGCDLSHFWGKNFGHINVIPLYHTVNDKTLIKDKFKLLYEDGTVETIIKGFSYKNFSSLTNCKPNRLPEGQLILPFITLDDQLVSLWGSPKEIKSIYIDPPDLKSGQPIEKRKEISLTYDSWKSISRISSLSPTYASNVINYCLQTIAGYGTHDFSPITQKAIDKDIKSALKD